MVLHQRLGSLETHGTSRYSKSYGAKGIILDLHHSRMGDFNILAYWSAKSSLILFKCQCMYMYALCYIWRETSVECLMHLCSCCTACLVVLSVLFVANKCECKWETYIYLDSTRTIAYTLYMMDTLLLYTQGTQTEQETLQLTKNTVDMSKKTTTRKYLLERQTASLGLQKYTLSATQYLHLSWHVHMHLNHSNVRSKRFHKSRSLVLALLQNLFHASGLWQCAHWLIWESPIHIRDRPWFMGNF